MRAPKIAMLAGARATRVLGPAMPVRARATLAVARAMLTVGLASKIALLMVGLMLWGGQALGQTVAQPSQPVQPHYSADGLYNLANSYARAGKPGLAVLNYERALLLAPNDPDINANLAYVRASAHVPTEPRNRFERIAQAVSPTLAAWIGVLGVALVGMGLLARRIAPRFRWLGVGGIVLGIPLIVLSVSNATLLWPRMHEAIVLINETPARVSPVPMGDTAFVLREAEAVTMTAEHEDFILVRTRGGVSGWVARVDLGAVVP